jgi:hypothetical protein
VPGLGCFTFDSENAALPPYYKRFNQLRQLDALLTDFPAKDTLALVIIAGVRPQL